MRILLMAVFIVAATLVHGQTLISSETKADTGWTIPNTFTPNGDGINDNFKLIRHPLVTGFQIRIFDRWGNKVFESTDAEFSWNGSDQFGGKELRTGVFAYVIMYEAAGAGGGKSIGGNLTLIR